VTLKIQDHESLGGQESSAKLTNQRVSYAFTSSPLSFHLVIFYLLPSSSIVILVFYLFSTEISEQHDMCENSTVSVNTVHWFDAFSSVTPKNNPITLISAVQSLGYIFVAADTLRSSANFRTVFSESQNASPLDPDREPDFNAKWPFKVIQGHLFRCQWEPLTGYIVQYNNCVHKCEGSEDIASERSENRHLRRPHTPLTPPFQRTSANIHINNTLLETRFPGLQFCLWQCVGSSSNFRTVLSESQKR